MTGIRFLIVSGEYCRSSNPIIRFGAICENYYYLLIALPTTQGHLGLSRDQILHKFVEYNTKHD